MIVYGVNILESEQTLLAARCLAEVGGHEIAPDLQQRVIDALIWRLSTTKEPRPVRRERAARALGQLRDPETISALVRTANKKVRKRWRGSNEYEMSNVRMAAAIALLQLMPEYDDKIAHLDPPLAEVLRVWLAEDVHTLITMLHGNEQEKQALAAFALGDLQTAEAVDALLAVFTNPGSDTSNTLWAATDALTLLDSGIVIEHAIQPLLHAKGQVKLSRSATLQQCLAYLIGKTQADTPEARDYLENSLRSGNASLQARAIRAIGELYDYIYRPLFEEIALNDFSNIPTENLTKNALLYLRLVAIETLANIGDDNTVTRLRQSRDGWPSALEQLFYYTSEEIAWRAGKLGTGSHLKEASTGH